MSNPNFEPNFSSNEIFRDQDTNRCLTDDLDAMDTAIAGKSAASHTHSGYAATDHTHSDYATTDHTHSGYAQASHSHAMSAVTGLPDALGSKANTNHTHEQSGVVGLSSALEGKAAANHTHTPSSIGAAASDHAHSGYATAEALGELSDEVDGKAAASHAHEQSDISGLATALGGKAAANHTHTPASIGAAAASHTHAYATLSEVYPVGSIYISVSNTNPATLFGGTWAAFGAGRVLVGVETGGSAEATGGSNSASIPNHKHTTAAHELTTDEIPPHHHFLLNYNANGTSVSYTNASVTSNINKGFDGNVGTGYAGGGESHSHGDTGNAGSQNISVVQPYITAYMWKRTA